MCSLAIVAICASTVLASAQATSSPTETGSTTASSSPSAYVYVASYVKSKNANQINAYSAAANGALAAIPGSPFPDNVGWLALNGAWLFAVDSTGEKIDSFSIAANGALALKDTYTNSTGQSLYDMFLDHTGATLYSDHYTTNNDYISLSINQSTGQLTYIGDLAGGPENDSEMRFIGNNVYAYSSSCYHFSPVIYGAERSSNGSLTNLNLNVPLPAEKSGGFYCPWLAAADPTNHVAIALQPLNSNWGPDGPWQLAVYTAATDGTLTTKSTYSNMPSVLVGAVNDYTMSPDGKYLAVSGTSGLQIFHFNGANPITKLTGLIATTQVQQVYWDNLDHLYAVSAQAGKLYVFSVTSNGATPAPGSPHSVPAPQSLIVLPK